MRDLRTIVLESLLFVLALPVLVLGVTFAAIFLWGGLSLVVEEMLLPLFRESDPYTWVLRLGAVEVLGYGAWWWYKNRARIRPLARTARPVRTPPSRQPVASRQPLPSRTAAGRSIRAA
ncbi:MAG TPA: hypothetical protein VE825_02540 [Terriglobales bacterium]|jgi:hypothetical protein|nr:hypothetical protein [Terriglobales bacterium]